MCFSIPYKITGVKNGLAQIEDGRKIRLGNDIRAGKGDYLQLSGNFAVGKLSKTEGLKVRQLIKSLN